MKGFAQHILKAKQEKARKAREEEQKAAPSKPAVEKPLDSWLPATHRSQEPEKRLGRPASAMPRTRVRGPGKERFDTHFNFVLTAREGEALIAWAEKRDYVISRWVRGLVLDAIGYRQAPPKKFVGLPEEPG